MERGNIPIYSRHMRRLVCALGGCINIRFSQAEGTHPRTQDVGARHIPSWEKGPGPEPETGSLGGQVEATQHTCMG